MTDIGTRISHALRACPKRLQLFNPTTSYQAGEVDEISGKIATTLIRKGIGRDDVVEIRIIDRLPAILVMIGVIRAGAAFCIVPITDPEARVALVRQRVLPVLSVASIDELLASDEPALVAFPKRTIDNLAYVIFTSGSTGEPKAVEITDRGLAYIVDQEALYRGTVIGQLATLQFDACIYEIFGGLLNGLSIAVVGKDELMDLPNLVSTFSNIDSVFLTTQLLNLFIDRNPAVFDGFSSVIFGGERVSVDHVRRVRERSPRLLHAYGPTETTVYATVHLVEDSDTADVPIGYALPGAEVWIGAEDLTSEVAEGEVGELLIAGEGLMRGYRGDEASTREATVAVSNRSFYRTGDLVRRSSNGSISFVARKDRQLKIAGYRIDPAETEAIAHRSGLVEQALAVGHKSKLWLFVTGCSDVHGLRAFLRKNLPTYGIPVVTPVSRIPLTPNGKTNVDELVASTSRAEANRCKVRDIFLSVLKIDAIDPTETFIGLGGDSIAAMEAVWQLDTMGVQVDLAAVFSGPLQSVIDNA